MTKRTWRDGYVPGKAKKTIHLDDEVARALEVKAAEERVSQAEIVERALRRELGMTETLTYREALEALRRQGYDIVRTNAYDQDITDHLNEMDDDGPEVNWSENEDGTVTLTELGANGYEVGGEALAHVIKVDAAYLVSRMDMAVLKTGRFDARSWATEQGFTVDDVDGIIERIEAEVKGGDETLPLIVVVEREADGTPWVVEVWEDRETASPSPNS